MDLEVDTPSHLRDLASATLGGVNALCLPLANMNGSTDESVEDGDTALHLACLYGYLPCVWLLLERGANLEAKDENRAIPLHDASAKGITEIIRLILDRDTKNQLLYPESHKSDG